MTYMIWFIDLYIALITIPSCFLQYSYLVILQNENKLKEKKEDIYI